MTRNITKQEIMSLITNRKVLILDIGSYDGTDSALIASHFEDVEVHCFECDPRNIELWKAKGHPGCIWLYPYAIGAINSYGILHLSEGRNHASSSLLSPNTHIDLFPEISFNKDEAVDVVCLDTWFASLKPRIIDLAWIDVNGAEGDVVKGGIDTLTYYTRYVHIEFSDKELYEGQVSKQQLIYLLPSFEVIEEYGFQGNFGNLLMKNKNL